MKRCLLLVVVVACLGLGANRALANNPPCSTIIGDDPTCAMAPDGCELVSVECEEPVTTAGITTPTCTMMGCTSTPVITVSNRKQRRLKRTTKSPGTTPTPGDASSPKVPINPALSPRAQAQLKNYENRPENTVGSIGYVSVSREGDTYVLRVKEIQYASDSGLMTVRPDEQYQLIYKPNATGGYDIFRDGKLVGTSDTPPVNKSDLRNQTRTELALAQLYADMRARNEVTAALPPTPGTKLLTQAEKTALAAYYPIAASANAAQVVKDFIDRANGGDFQTLDLEALKSYLSGKAQLLDTINDDTQRFYDLLDALTTLRNSGYQDLADSITQNLINEVSSLFN